MLKWKNNKANWRTSSCEIHLFKPVFIPVFTRSWQNTTTKWHKIRRSNAWRSYSFETLGLLRMHIMTSRFGAILPSKQFSIAPEPFRRINATTVVTTCQASKASKPTQGSRLVREGLVVPTGVLCGSHAFVYMFAIAHFILLIIPQLSSTSSTHFARGSRPRCCMLCAMVSDPLPVKSK